MLYSNAAKQSPGCEDILSHLFISYVRVNDFASQQLVAMQLYKLKPKNPYYFWAVMSVVLKVNLIFIFVLILWFGSMKMNEMVLSCQIFSGNYPLTRACQCYDRSLFTKLIVSRNIFSKMSVVYRANNFFLNHYTGCSWSGK